MAGKFKYSKVAIVVLITVLIWVWADLAQDETVTVRRATISLAKTINPSLRPAARTKRRLLEL
jgi:hypothetical protein